MVGMSCDGGYAEYLKLPAHIFIKLPPALDYKAYPAQLGVVTDALATPYKVLGRAQVRAGETVAVFGAGGGVGIHQLMMAKWARDPRDRRRYRQGQVRGLPQSRSR